MLCFFIIVFSFMTSYC